jgi:branched-chain amino acid transport system permease protein
MEKHTLAKNEIMATRSILLVLIYVVFFTLFIIIFPIICNNKFLLHVAILANIFALVAISWDLLFGFVGILNLAPAVFYGAGAYTVGFLTKYCHIHPIGGLIIAGCVGLLLSLLLGLPSLRLRGAYYAMATLAFSAVLHTLALGMPNITGGEEGIIGIPSLISGTEWNFYFSSCLVLTCVLALKYMLSTKYGKKLTSIREDEILSQAAGIDTSKYKVIASTIGGVIAGLAGGYSCYYFNNVAPEVFSIAFTFSIITITVTGGIGTIIGPVIGSYLLTFANENLYIIGQYRLLVYSGIIIFVILFSPTGIIGAVKKLKGN